jgi:D-serine deaminase-like pyridoxal phosphate-dependent protein
LQIREIETPAVLVDLDILERNIATMREKLSARQCGLRPHAKAHKSAFVAHKQLAAGAIGVTCQTVDEAETMVMSGVNDVLLTNMVVTHSKINRILNLLKHSRVSVTVDNLENIRALGFMADEAGKILDLVVEINVGQNRTGVSPGRPALDLARHINVQRALRFKGLMGYEGHLQCTIPNFDERSKKTREALAPLIETKHLIEDAHIPVGVVTAGGTGTYNITSAIEGVTEIQPGSYVTMDHRYRMMDTSGKDFGCSLSVLATVISRPSKERAIVDLGWKSVGLEYQILGWQGMPVAKNDNGISYSPGGDEHGILTLSGESTNLKLGDKIEFIPSHCDTTLNLHGKFYGVRKENVEVVCPTVRR